MATSKPTVLFSPGGFHLPWVFDTVRNTLSSRGFPTAATALLTVGATDKTVGIHDDARNLRSVLAGLVEEGKEVILVAHSYSGIVIANAVEGLGVKQRAAEGKQGGVLIAIWMTSIVIPAGETIMAQFDPNKLPWKEYGDGFVTAGNLDEFYLGVEPAIAQKAASLLKPMPISGYGETSNYEPWNQGIDVGYVFTTKDNILPINAQKAMASRFPDGYFSATIDCGHWPIFTNPDGVADAIQGAMDYVRAKAQ